MAQISTLEHIADWANQTSQKWPEIAYNAAIHAFTDTIACMVSGSSDDAAVNVRKTINCWSDATGATIVGSDHRAPAPFAAFAPLPSAELPPEE